MKPRRVERMSSNPVVVFVQLPKLYFKIFEVEKYNMLGFLPSNMIECYVAEKKEMLLLKVRSRFHRFKTHFWTET